MLESMHYRNAQRRDLDKLERALKVEMIFMALGSRSRQRTMNTNFSAQAFD